MQTVLYDGKIYCERGRFAEALLIEDDEIIKVGTNEDVLLAADNALLIDCAGHTVIPGLNDSHMHLVNLALSYSQVDLKGTRSIAEIIERSRDFIRKNPELTANGLNGRGWNQDLFTGANRLPDRHDLDQISTAIPVVLKRVCGHVVAANTKALEMLGLNANSPQYPSGTFLKEDNGYPNGLFTEFACEYPCSLIPPLSGAALRSAIIKAMTYAVSCGLTTIQSNDIDDFVKQEDRLKLISDIFTEEEALLRYRFQCCFSDPDSFAAVLAKGGYRLAVHHPWLTLGPLKLFKDGSLGGHTALLRTAYQDDPGNVGIEVLSDAVMDRYCELAGQYHIQVITHAIGDQAITKVMDSYQRTAQVSNRNSLVHCQITDRQLLKRIAAEQVYVQCQPVFLEYDLHIAVPRVGVELARTSYAFNSLAKLKAHVSYGSDCPVEDCNPFLNIYCAVTRRDYDGQPLTGFVPEECVDVATAIDAYTLGSAEVEFAEQFKGRLKAGYVADLVMLDRDIFTIDPQAIKEIQSLLTMVDGEIVYNK